MKSGASFLSPPPSPSVAPLPLPSTSALKVCPELDLSVMSSPTHMHPKQQKNKQRKRKTKAFLKEPVVVKVISEPQIQPLSDASSRQPTSNSDHLHGKQNPRTGTVNQKTELTAAISYDHPDVLEEVELNTTLALKAKLLELQGAEFNTQKAVQETLQEVEQTKKQINSKATQGTNVSRSQTLFTSLVSVDVPESQLISQAVKDKLVLAPAPRSLDTKVTEGPSPLIFLTPDLFRQRPFPVEEEPVITNHMPAPYPSSSTFDLFRRRSRWEAAP